MSLSALEAEAILRARIGAPINPVPHGSRAGEDNDKVLGFATPDGRVLALDRKISDSPHIWFEPPAPPEIEGIERRAQPSIHSNLSGRLSALNNRQGLQIEAYSESGLHQFLDWYFGTTANSISDDLLPSQAEFTRYFEHFQELITAYSGHPFQGFDEGLAAVWEDYKPRLREHALGILNMESWSESDLGSGSILKRVIDAIEINDNRVNLTNNLVLWQNMYGHANRDHRALIEGRTDQNSCRALESALFSHFREDVSDRSSFERLSVLVGAKYRLLAYLFFLKDMDRFTPIHPTGFDRAFKAMEIKFSSRGQCTWENYSTFLSVLGGVRERIEMAAAISNVRLIDAHSFCWIFATLLKFEAEGELKNGSTQSAGKSDDGRVLGRRDISIMEMRSSIEKTVRNSNGQMRNQKIKNKETDLNTVALEELLKELLDLQENRCALTGIPFEFSGPASDQSLLPSADRIDSDGHYVRGNVQVVCRFINFWKGSQDNDEFLRLLSLVRGVEDIE